MYYPGRTGEMKSSCLCVRITKQEHCTSANNINNLILIFSMESQIIGIGIFVFWAIITLIQLFTIRSLRKSLKRSQRMFEKLKEVKTEQISAPIVALLAEMFSQKKEEVQKTPLESKIEELLNLENDGSMSPMQRAAFLMKETAAWTYATLNPIGDEKTSRFKTVKNIAKKAGIIA